MKYVFFTLSLFVAATSFAQTQQTSYDVYPNPVATENELTIKIDKPAKFDVYNIMGAKVIKFEVTQDDCTPQGICQKKISFNGIPPGKYIIQGKVTLTNEQLKTSVFLLK